VKIFVAYDRTDGAAAALDAAVGIAEQCAGSQVRIVHALNPLIDAAEIFASSNHEAITIRRDEELTALHEVASKISSTEVEPAVEVLRRGESPGAGIARLGNEWQADLIAVASRRTGRLSGALLGSVAAEIFRNSETPLLLVHPA